jgi:hypothetical protein
MTVPISCSSTHSSPQPVWRGFAKGCGHAAGFEFDRPAIRGGCDASAALQGAAPIAGRGSRAADRGLSRKQQHYRLPDTLRRTDREHHPQFTPGRWKLLNMQAPKRVIDSVAACAVATLPSWRVTRQTIRKGLTGSQRGPHAGHGPRTVAADCTIRAFITAAGMALGLVAAWAVLVRLAA